MSDKLCIRPSSVDTFLQCPQQWYQVFIKGRTSIPNARAAIGTAIHRGIEVMWTDAIKHNKKDPNISMMTDASIEAYKEEAQKGLQYDEDENENTAAAEIVKGTEAFVDDIVPFAAIPKAVEIRFEVPIANHPLINAVGGTIDYLEEDALADVKTTKRTPSTANYIIQQSLYKYLAVANGVKIEHNFIHGIVLTKQAKGTILALEPNVEMAKTAVNSILDTTEVLASDKINPDVLFRGNPKYYLCSAKYCAFYNECKFVKGEAK